ncbi:MAG: S9 family peptidase, partial [Bacteroidia bacterium]|nr:S9 family peptidase [Bacteroidia bacterium]
MKYFLSAIILIFLFPSTSVSQNKLFTMEDAVVGANLRPNGITHVSWIGETNKVAYVLSNGDDEDLYVVDATTANKTVVLKLSAMNKVLKDQGLDELGRFPSMEWINSGEFEFTSKRKILRYRISAGKVEEKGNMKLDENAANIDEDPVSGSIAYTIDNNLNVLKNDKVLKVTNDSDIGIVNGQAVHRFEFGIFKGTFWSPKGNYLAFYRKDETMVSDYPVVDWSAMPAANKNIKYPMAGGKSHHVTLGVYNMQTGSTTYIKSGEPKEQYLTNIAWSPDEKHIYIVVLNRDQSHFKMNRYDAQTGEFDNTIFEEKHDKYIQPLHTMEFVEGRP